MLIRHLLLIVSFALLSFATASATFAAAWGDLSGTFVLDGPPPTPVPITVTKDVEYCGKHKLVNESLVVNAATKGVANIIVYLEIQRGQPKPETHPSYAESAAAEVRLDNDKCRFQPHVVLLQTTQTLILGNKDAVGHNTKVDTFVNPPINPIIPAGADLKSQFPSPERLPSQVSCNIHPWMNAWLVIKDHPYMAASDSEGAFQLKNLPAGKWTFQAWHEKSGYVQEVNLNGKATKWTKGRFELTIKPGLNDLGTILVSPAVFQK
jgi:hypothetical protein